jgi:hypothetical protein
MDYKEYVGGKRIIIVGPATYITNRFDGCNIDSKHDVVVRLNNQYIIPERYKKHIGSRTNIVYAAGVGPKTKKRHGCVH